jgi:hypothetical protein
MIKHEDEVVQKAENNKSRAVECMHIMDAS